MSNYHWIVVGAGMTGSTFARMKADNGERVLMIEKRQHIGGNCFDSWTEGHLLHKYGPHLFHTNSQKVMDFLMKFANWEPYEHKVQARINGQNVPLPINLTSIATLFPRALADEITQALVARYGIAKTITVGQLRTDSAPNSALALLSDFVFNEVFVNYTMKQWGEYAKQLDPSVMGRVPVRVSYDDRYFTDKYQVLPRHGYTRMFESMLDHPNIHVMLNVDFDTEQLDWGVANVNTFHTGSIDSYFNYKLGPLPYRSLAFTTERTPAHKATDVATLNLPSDPCYTRVTNQTLVLGDPNAKVHVLTYEEPRPFDSQDGGSERYYPIPAEGPKKLHQQYVDLLKDHPNLYFAGRLGSYQYLNMDQACAQGMQRAETL